MNDLLARCRNWLVGLGLLYAAALLLFVSLAYKGHLTASILAAGLIGLLAATEGVSRLVFRRRCPTHTSESGRMAPHIFCHFLPSSEFSDVSADGFRTLRRDIRPGSQRPSLYLAGDCTIFETHLPIEDTFAHQLGQRMPAIDMLAAGAPHYTAAHAYHRFAVDLIKGYRPSVVILASAANDCLSFIHHKGGVAASNHTHMYRPWRSLEDIHLGLARFPTATLKLFFATLYFDSQVLSWEKLVENIDDDFRDPSKIEIARKIFDPEPFKISLGLFLASCRGIGAQFIPATYRLNRPDMAREPRATCAWGIDRLNDVIRAFARENGLPLLDFDKELVLGPNDIFNKWHYTSSGNLKRTDLAVRLQPLHALIA